MIKDTGRDVMNFPLPPPPPGLLKELIPSAESEPYAEDVDEVIKDTGRNVMNFPLPPPPPGNLVSVVINHHLNS